MTGGRFYIMKNFPLRALIAPTSTCIRIQFVGIPATIYLLICFFSHQPSILNGYDFSQPRLKRLVSGTESAVLYKEPPIPIFSSSAALKGIGIQTESIIVKTSVSLRDIPFHGVRFVSRIGYWHKYTALYLVS
jgi:hypothetical protein